MVGRLVLLFLPDPAATLRRVANHVRAGGVLAFHEMDFTGRPLSLPPSPLYEKVISWVTETYRRGKVETQMGLKLYQTFIRAGLPAPQMIMEARVEGGPDSPAYAYVAQSVRSMLPMIEQLEVVTAEEVQIETLAERLRDEVVAGGGVITLPNLVGAWTRKPS